MQFEGFGAPTPPGDQTYGLSVSGRTTLDGEFYLSRSPFLSAEPAFRESLGVFAGYTRSSVTVALE